MEYQSMHWLDAGNTAYVKPPVAKAGYAFCEVCWMQVDPKSSPMLSYKGKKYYFCMPSHEQAFEASPERFMNA
jgi:YHS domain-containing protein